MAEVAGWSNNLWEEIAERGAVSLTEEEVGRIFGVLEKEQKARNTRDKFIIALILETGISISTLVRLNLTDVNPKAKQIKVNSEGDHWCSFEGAFQHLNQDLTEFDRADPICQREGPVCQSDGRTDQPSRCVASNQSLGGGSRPG